MQFASILLYGVMSFLGMALLDKWGGLDQLKTWAAFTLLLIVNCPPLEFIPVVAIWAAYAKIAQMWESRESRSGNDK